MTDPQPKRKHLFGVASKPVASKLRAARPWSDPLEASDPEWAERKRSWKAAIRPYTDRFDRRNDGPGQRGEW